MRKAITLILLFLVSTLSPLASGVTTETQFASGETSYTHTFNGQGNGSAGQIDIPYGAEVSAANFNLRGDPSSAQYSNLTTDRDFGGKGSASWSGQPPGMAYGYKSNVEMDNDEVQLLGQPTLKSVLLDQTAQIASSTATHNTSGAFLANGDQGFISVSEKPTSDSLSGGTWSYPGSVVKMGDEYHVLMSTSSSTNYFQAIYRWNASTGAYIGAATLNYGTCSTSYLRYTHDMAKDGENTVWTVSYNYYSILKWTVSGGTWSCQQQWTLQYPNYIGGIDIDESTGKMWLYIYQNQFPNYNHYLWEVSKTNPTNVNGTYLLGNNLDFTGTAAGLQVNGPRVTLNTYSSSFSTHHHYHLDGMWAERLGTQILQARGHYGLTDMEDGTIAYTCFFINQCSASSRKILFSGSGSPFDLRQATSSSSIVTGATTSLSRAITEVELEAGVAWMPTNTSVEYEVSVDGGAVWKSIVPTGKTSFTNAGSQLKWRAYLNGTSTETPVLDLVVLSYTTTYTQNGYFYLRSNYNTLNPVAVQIFWNSTLPGSSSMSFEVQTSGTKTWSSSDNGKVKTVSSTTSYVYVYVRFYAGSGNTETPTLHDLNITFFTNAPQNVGLDVGGDGSKEWSLTGPFLGTTTASGSALVNAFNKLIPNTGTGMVSIPIDLSSSSAGIMSIESFSVDYVMKTVNLGLEVNESYVLHERNEPYSIISRHIIGEDASIISEASLRFLASPSSAAPTLTWNYGDSTPTENDPESWVIVDPTSTWTESNGILEIDWRFRITSNMPDQNSVHFSTNCIDDVTSPENAPISLVSNVELRVNQSYGLGWMMVRDNEGAVTWDDVPDGMWVAAGDMVHFQGQLWFDGTDDTPKDNAFDMRIARNGYVDSAWRDTSNPNGTFYISVEMPNIDIEDGIDFEVQTYNERDATMVMPINQSWRRTFKVDATAPQFISSSPKEGEYEAASEEHQIQIKVEDAVGSPEQLTLWYWVEADHDSNRNGEADIDEYVGRVMTNNSNADVKWYRTNIDDSRNPNMGRVSYFVEGSDPAGNILSEEIIIDESSVLIQHEAGFDFDTATYLTRKDSDAIFTGLNWVGHWDDMPVYAGQDQTIILGLVDANTVIDFEEISLVFDFEGPNPENDQQVIAYSGVNDSWWSNSEYIILDPSSHVILQTNTSGLPWIHVNFNFQFTWDWPDEDWGDLALVYKELGNEKATRHESSDHSFRVENDLVLSSNDFKVLDISEPRTGPIADGSKVRSDDRLSFQGRVVYEGSNIEAPRNLGITIDVFDGETIWSDGSLGVDGDYSIEVPLDHASSLASASTRTCLISISGIPGRGEDMTGASVSTTLRIDVDHSPPRVTTRVSPIDIIDISAKSDLSNLEVEFKGWEDDDLTGSIQIVNWIMRDHMNTVTIGSGSSVLGMKQDGQVVNWSGTVDLTDSGRITPRMGDIVGFWITGYDSAGNPFLEVGNSPSNPIQELVSVDTDHELGWVYLGAEVADLKLTSISISDSHIAPGTTVEIRVIVLNTGGEASTPFSVAFYSGDSSKAFESKSINSLEAGQSVELIVLWEAEAGVDRVRATIDPENVVVEVNEDDNTAEHGVEIVYVSYFGWVDNVREQPLAWIFAIVGVIVATTALVISKRTALNTNSSIFNEDYFEDDSDEDSDDDEEEWDEDEY